MSARAVALALLVALAAPAHVAGAASPSPAGCPPGIGVGLLQFPGDRADDPRARSYVIDHVAPGATFSREFQVCNGTSAPVTAQLYATSAAVSNGAFVAAEGRADSPLTRAVTISPSSLTLPPQGIGVATATFRIPRDAQAGEQYAVIFAETPASGSGPVGVASRAGIRVYLDIGPGGEKPSDFRVDTLQASRRGDGRPVVTARVTNTGARALDLRGELRLSAGPAGLSAGPFPVDVGTTLGIGASGPVTVVLPKEITGGPWTATITLTSGLLERRAEGRVTFPDTAGQQAPPVRAKNIPFTDKQRLPLWTAAGLIFILALLLLVVGLLTSRRRAREKQRQ